MKSTLTCTYYAIYYVIIKKSLILTFLSRYPANICFLGRDYRDKDRPVETGNRLENLFEQIQNSNNSFEEGSYTYLEYISELQCSVELK